MKKTILALAVALSSLGCAAVTFPFNVTAPTWNEVAECTTEGGVNIRKAPSTTAPKLVYNEAKIEDFETPLKYLAYWGSRTGGNIHAVTFNGIAPVVSIKDGWIELLKEGPKNESNAWVSSKYCKVTEITPIRASSNPASPQVLFFNIEENVYAIYLETDEMNGEATFYIGKVADGKIVCPYAYTCEYYDCVSNESDSPSISKNQFGSYCYYATKKGQTEIIGEYGEYYTPNISKLPAETLDFVIKQAKPLDSTTIIYLYDGKYCILY